mmetsp:Transcript_3434/g.7502  ORF Transcript_3434/g.7502 Transcript_3434/m.7502 type:complete len:299 (+) Transcript_3434:340-1236(+)
MGPGGTRHPPGDQLLRPPRGIRGGFPLSPEVPADPNHGEAGPVRRPRRSIHRLFVHQRGPRMDLRPAAVPLHLVFSGRLSGPFGDRRCQHGRRPLGDVCGSGRLLRTPAPRAAHALFVPPDPQAPPPAALSDAGIPRCRERAPHRARHRGDVHLGRRPGGGANHEGPRGRGFFVFQHPRRPGDAEPLPLRRRVRHNTLWDPEILGGEPRDAPPEVYGELRTVFHVVRPLYENLCRVRGALRKEREAAVNRKRRDETRPDTMRGEARRGGMLWHRGAGLLFLCFFRGNHRTTKKGLKNM